MYNVILLIWLLMGYKKIVCISGWIFWRNFLKKDLEMIEKVFVYRGSNKMVIILN